MKASIAAAESVCQSSVRSLPRRFGDLDEQIAPLGFSETERKLSMYDGGSELALLEAVPESERSKEQTKVLQDLDPDEWCRPCLPLRAPDRTEQEIKGTCVRESVYSKPISQFAVGQCPEYRCNGALWRMPQPVASDSQSQRLDEESTAKGDEACLISCTSVANLVTNTLARKST